MENDCRVNSVSLEMNHDVAESSSGSQSESNSVESGVTAETSCCDADSKLDDCAGWTNEKHNSYLDQLENSFVRQLYSFLGGDTQRLSRTRDAQSSSHKSTDQFTVLQNGCWQKVKFRKKQAPLETSSEFHFEKNLLRRKPQSSNGNYTTGSTVQGLVLCHEETKHSEASGQNFREEEEEEEEEKVEVSRKREREAKNDDSLMKDDQVVPVRMVKPRM